MAARMSHQLATPTRHWTRANVCPFSMAKFAQCISMLCSFWLGTGTGNVIPGSGRIPAPSHSSIRNKTLFPTQGLRGPQNYCFFSSQHCKGDTIHWPDPLQKWKLWRECFSHSGHCLTSASVPVCWVLTIDLNWIAAQMSHQLMGNTGQALN